MEYRENSKATEACREKYLEGFENIINDREEKADAIRKDYAGDIFENQQKYRDDFKKMLGCYLPSKRTEIVQPTSEKLYANESCTLYRMTFETIKGFPMTGLLFLKNDGKKRPMILCQHGGLGTPELIAGIYGSSGNYNDMAERVLKYDVNVFCPQLLLWSSKDYGVPFNRQAVDARLKRVGSSVTDVEIYSLLRIMDYFETCGYVKNFGMIGLSYGGFYTLFTAACDERIRACVSCSFFSERKRYAWSDWTWQSSAEKFNDAEIACLVYPRYIAIEVGDSDELFGAEHARREAQRLKELSEGQKEHWFDFIEFCGTHEFCKDNEPIEKVVNILLNE